MNFGSAVSTPLAPEPLPPPRRLARTRRPRARTSLLAHGEPLVWLTAGALASALLMIVGILLLVLVAGAGTFWPRSVYEIRLADGRRYLGELTAAETFRLTGAQLDELAARPRARAAVGRRGNVSRRTQVRTGDSFAWIDDYQVVAVRRPRWVLDIERRSGERLYAEPVAIQAAGKTIARGAEPVWRWFRELGHPSEARMLLATLDRGRLLVPVDSIVRAYPANQLTIAGKLRVYGARWGEFLTAGPRAANTAGGVFPAIVGTATMTLFMSLAVVPFGVLAALYLREYARPGPVVSLVRIAVNNLAGVPSIVFGVFGLGFFCYLIGGTLDRLFFADRLPAQPTLGKGGLLWASLTLALLTLPVVIVATEEALAAVPRSLREGSYACGASRWQTLRRIVLPRAMPGVMTGLILAMARGAGEVAPLMLVGVTNLAFKLPIDTSAPFIHLDRKFMHLGFHIYSLGFQSPNSEAARPLVFTTTLLLVALISCLNIVAVRIRTALRRRHAMAQF
jgi:phosphate transport system permease protein